FTEVSAADFMNLTMNLPNLAWHLLPYHVTPLRVAKLASANLKLCVYCETLPQTDSRITLSSERDALGLFRVRVDWRSSEQEIVSISRFVEVMRECFSRYNLGQIDPDPDLLADYIRIERKFRDTYHHMGGTRMATSPANGVVDTNLRLFGMHNLYVCSSSV